MVATAHFVSTGGSGAMADYYLKPTQPEWERNQDLEYRMQDIPEFSGTVPIFQRNMAPQVAQAFRLDMQAMQRAPHEQMRHLFAGHAADGGPSGKRQMAAYTRHDGKEFVPKTHFDITVSNDISVGIALNNTETPAARALILGAALDANAYAVDRLAERIGWTRQGAGGRQIVPAYPLIASFMHHATRPTQSGFVAPNLHFHNVVFSPVVTEYGHVGALYTTKMRNECITQVKWDYHAKLEDNFNKLGIATQRLPIGAVRVSDVPHRAIEFFGQRGQEIVQRARENAQKKGLDYDSLSASARGKFFDVASRQTRGASEDGVSDPQGWRLHLMRLDYTARDLPRLAFRSLHMALESNLRPAHALREEARQTWQQTRQARQQATLRDQPMTFSVRARRQAVAATLALRLATAQPTPAQALHRQFADLAGEFSKNKNSIAMRLQGKRLVRSLAPVLVQLRGLQQMSESKPIQTQPLEADRQALGGYLAQRHRLPEAYAAQLGSASQLVAEGRMPLSHAAMSIAGGIHNESLTQRITSAITQGAEFYDSASNKGAFVMIGTNDGKAPVAFVNSFADAALMREATNNKLPVVVSFSDEGTARNMQNWRNVEPNREFVRISDFNGNTPRLDKVAMVIPPTNAANASNWQEYAKAYGVEAVGSSVRQAYRQEFRQSFRQSQAAE